MSAKQVSRRKFLQMGALGTATLIVAGCQSAATPTPKPEPTQVSAPTTAPQATTAPVQPTAVPVAKFNEAPILAEQVKAGKLPAVVDRLPTEPVVIKPVESVGKYGGTWHTVWKGVSDSSNLNNHLRCVRPVRLPAANSSEVLPDMCDTWQVSTDAKVYTFHIRKGLKWSDGEPVTTDDVMFWWKDCIGNQELNPAVPSWLKSGGEPCTVEAKDSQTFVVTFKQSYGLFAVKMAANDGGGCFIGLPKHYLSKFHPSYADKSQLDKAIKDAKFDTWVQLFDQMSDSLMNPELPVLTAFMAKTAPDETAHVVWVRNPFYHRVDTAGNQLPYIDQVEFKAASSADVGVLMAANGEVDMQIRFYRDADFTPLKQNEQQGNYTVVPYGEYRGNTDATLLFNQTCSEPVLREIFRDVRFRQAVSLSQNREEINKVVYLGLGTPRQASFPSGDPYYDPEWAKWYAEYDPDKANKLLDEMGLDKRGADGFRLRPDGKTLEVIFEFQSSDGKSSSLDELQKEYLEKIGIKCNLQPRDRTLFTQRVQTPEVQLTRWSFGAQFLNMEADFIPLQEQTGSGWATEWARWFSTDGKSGEEPPEELQRVRELIDTAYSTSDEAARKTAIQEIVQIWKDGIWVIGTVGENPRAGVIRNSFKNVPKEMPYGGYLSIPAPYCDQFYFES